MGEPSRCDRQLRLGYVPQDDEFASGQTVQQVVLGALADASLDEHVRLTKVAILLDRIGFVDPEQPVEGVSGGWKKRLSLCATAHCRAGSAFAG